MSARPWIAAVLIAWLAPLATASAASPVLEGEIDGVELAPQSAFGFALFLFEFDGEVNGITRRGWGWMAATHDTLPVDFVGETAAINDGFGEIYIGFRRFDVEILGGELELIDLNDPDVFDDDYAVTLSVDICNVLGQCQEHVFIGGLSHQTFIPTISGDLLLAP